MRQPSHLNRDLGRKHLADKGYAREEFVAELGILRLRHDPKLFGVDDAEIVGYGACELAPSFGNVVA